LKSIAEIICSDYLLRLSAEISCCYYLLRTTVEAICCAHLLFAKKINKPMSIPSKTRKDQKAHEHNSKSEQGMQKHQKTHEHTIKNKKRSKSQ
jgi:hypothetical protein